jgi:hypothetical protein
LCAGPRLMSGSVRLWRRRRRRRMVVEMLALMGQGRMAGEEEVVRRVRSSRGIPVIVGQLLGRGLRG